MKRTKENEGITLVALVVTIIVLLILAGVAISLIVENNGIFSRATQAKRRNQGATIEEQIKMSIMSSRINESFELDLQILEIELRKYEITEIEKQGENGALPWKIMKGGFIFQITEDGDVVEVNTLLLNKTVLKLIQGEIETLIATKTEGITGNIMWNSSDTSVATVENGKITVVGAGGTAEITASVPGTEYRAKCTVIVVQKVTEINISNFEIGVGIKKGISEVVTTTPTGETEKLTYELISSDSSILSVNNENKTMTGLAEGTATITVKAKRKDGTELPSKTSTVTVTSLIGKFVKYDVSYADMYLNNTEGKPLIYSTTNGWRILQYKYNEDGTFSNVELISTGIPAKLYYSYTQENNEWYVKDEVGLNNFKINILGQDYAYYTGNAIYYGLQAAAGMYYNLKDIVFRYGTEAGSYHNQGFYKFITKSGTVYDSTNSSLTESGADLFKVGNVDLRMLTLPEINKARNYGKSSTETIMPQHDKNALFRLDQIKNIKGMEQYDYSWYGEYWVASPDSNTRNNSFMTWIHQIGGIMYGAGTEGSGVRPVISLKSNIILTQSLDGTYYEIK